ncbi:G-protein coupled receptor 55a [Trichomycterus rosablanca]|uniref:G-protein coupled receptor 55a n=1 Tax=Trichomycterus rosablanca TaxID=2290929 RepID=UPI002F354E8F
MNVVFYCSVRLKYRSYCLELQPPPNQTLSSTSLSSTTPSLSSSTTPSSSSSLTFTFITTFIFNFLFTLIFNFNFILTFFYIFSFIFIFSFIITFSFIFFFFIFTLQVSVLLCCTTRASLSSSSDTMTFNQQLNNTNSSTEWMKHFKFGIYIPVFTAGLPLNMAALWQLFFRVRRWNESTVYLLNLIINDCLLLLTLPFQMLAYGRPWTLGPSACSLFEIFTYVNIYGSILLIVCIAVDRYMALRFPFRRLQSPRKAAIVCVLMWAVIFGFSFPVYSLHPKNQSESYCFQHFSNQTWNKKWIVVCAEVVFCSSAVVMVFCSVQVVKILRELRQRNPNDIKLCNNKSMKIVLSNLVVFLVCFIPYHVAMLLYFHFKRSGDPGIQELRYFVHASLCVSNVNCLADGVCYYFILKENLQTAHREAKANRLTQQQFLSSIRGSNTDMGENPPADTASNTDVQTKQINIEKIVY